MSPLFRTPVVLEETPLRAEYSHPFFILGSCFAGHMGQRLHDLKFTVCCNPFGVLFNPVSIAQSLLRLSREVPFTSADLNYDGELWFSYDAHGSFSHPDSEQCLWAMNEALTAGAQGLRQARYMVVTLGTAWVYVHKEQNRVVANCHKLPAGSFVRERWEPARIATVLEDALTSVWQINPELQVVFTVSPVRHLKDGCHGNQVSKASLLLAVEALCGMFSLVSYFPAYEIMMDELRDYRFYDAQMTHPSPVAVDYIWSRFAETSFSPEAQLLMKEISGIMRACEHRPLHIQSASSRAFMLEYARRTEQLQKQYPFLDLTRERKYFEEGHRE